MSRAIAVCVLPCTALWFTACAATPSPVTFVESDLSCVDDSARCISARRRGLTALMGDRQKAWQSQPPTAQQYAAGVRMFAYNKQRARLSCAELKRGTREAKAAGATLRGPGGRGLTPAQISRGAMLGDEVARNLTREHRKRCRTSS